MNVHVNRYVYMYVVRRYLVAFTSLLLSCILSSIFVMLSLFFWSSAVVRSRSSLAAFRRASFAALCCLVFIDSTRLQQASKNI